MVDYYYVDYDSEESYYWSESEDELSPEEQAELDNTWGGMAGKHKGKGGSKWDGDGMKERRNPGDGPKLGAYTGRCKLPMIPPALGPAFNAWIMQEEKVKRKNRERGARLVCSSVMNRLHTTSGVKFRDHKMTVNKTGVPLKLFNNVYVELLPTFDRWGKSGPLRGQWKRASEYAASCLRSYFQDLKIFNAGLPKESDEVSFDTKAWKDYRYKLEHGHAAIPPMSKYDKELKRYNEAKEALEELTKPLELPLNIKGVWRRALGGNETIEVVEKAKVVSSMAKMEARDKEVQKDSLEKRIVMRQVKDGVRALPPLVANARGVLQEALAKQNVRISYIDTPLPNGTFVCLLSVKGHGVRLGNIDTMVTSSPQRTKKAAQQDAAVRMLDRGVAGSYPALLVDGEKRRRALEQDQGVVNTPVVKIVLDDPLVASQLNGNAGEWTNGDDMPSKGKGGQKGGSLKQKVKANVGQIALAAARAARNEALARTPKVARPVAKMAMGHIGKMLNRKIIGRGDYTSSDGIERNPIVSGKVRTDSQFHDKSHGTIFMLREYVTDVRTGPSAGVFNVNSFDIQPANSYLFPILSTFAQGFQNYEIEAMVFEFDSSSSNYNSGGALGTVIMSYSSNPTSSEFINKTQMENSANAVSFRMDKGGIYGIECAKFANMMNSYLVRNLTGGEPVSQINTDMGKFSIATQPSTTFATNSVVGELHVSYRIRFTNPRQPPGRFGYFHLFRNTCINGSNLGNQNTAYENIVFGAGYDVSCASALPSVIKMPNTSPGDIWNMTFMWSNTTSLAFLPPNISIIGGALLSVYPSISGGPNTVSQRMSYTAGDSNLPPSSTSTCAVMIMEITVRITSAATQDTLITVSGGTVASAGVCTCEIYGICVGSNLPSI